MPDASTDTDNGIHGGFGSRLRPVARSISFTDLQILLYQRTSIFPFARPTTSASNATRIPKQGSASRKQTLLGRGLSPCLFNTIY